MLNYFLYDICNVLWSSSHYWWYRFRYLREQLSCESFIISYLYTFIFLNLKNTKKIFGNYPILCCRIMCSSLNFCPKTLRLWFMHSEYHLDHCGFYFQSVCFFLLLLLSSIFLWTLSSKSSRHGSRNRISSWNTCFYIESNLFGILA